VSQFKTEADTFLIKNRIYNACKLNDGSIAIATRRGGIAIINTEGSLSRIVNLESGLYSDVIYDVFQDEQGGLWIATTEGISRIEYPSSFSILPKNKTGNDFISQIYRFKNEIYASNSFGLLYFDGPSSKLKIIPGINSTGDNFVSI
jgi:ligand-binding sensor domain-containing protein